MNRCRKGSVDRRDTASILRELGYPVDLPSLPARACDPDKLFQPSLEGPWGQAAAYARLHGIKMVLSSENRWAVGVGRDESTGEPAVTFLVRERAGKKVAEAAMPTKATLGTHSFPVREMELSPDSLALQYAPRHSLVRNTSEGGFTGSAISPDTRTDGGTLAGTFNALTGSSQRGVTCAHVALGFGIEQLLNNLPSSLGSLFRSPSGAQMIASGGPNIGQDMFQLFEVDTPWPVLTFVPFALVPGSLTFLYVDVAAGRIRPTALPGGPPPPAGLPDRRTTVFGARLSSSSFPIPGENVYKIGQTTGVTWGRCLISSLFIPIPIPLLPVIVLFYLNVHELAIAPGDSGCLGTGNPGQEAYDILGLGLGATATSGNRSINRLAMGVPFDVAGLFGNFRG